uniref:Secreted protein n=1 Tax=Steinernema glaseri TaxID=37863 RepID=A0A1I7Z857_9BILA
MFGFAKNTLLCGLFSTMPLITVVIEKKRLMVMLTRAEFRLWLMDAFPMHRKKILVHVCICRTCERVDFALCCVLDLRMSPGSSACFFRLMPLRGMEVPNLGLRIKTLNVLFLC